jgi:hypothetical protein
VSTKKSIVTGYLGYGSSVHTDDYYTTSGNRPFRDHSERVTSIIASKDLCSSNEIYSDTVYTGENHANVSLTVLYKTLSTSNVTNLQNNQIKAQIDVLEKKNKMFYSFFVTEYCYYNTMYNRVLENFFAEYVSTTTVAAFASSITLLKTSSGTTCAADATPTAQANRLDALSLLLARINSRLIDMRSLLSAIQAYYSRSLDKLQDTLNTTGGLGSDSEAITKVTSLRDQSAGVEESKDASMYRQGIMEYTSEKNRYSNILLGIYAFLNIAIVSVIFSIKE